ncbi:four helix bundle protein [Flagellimonas onchidii]|uniref:four helix bundle protein n=1 Tax=Flagellimonas onchidii TaxID=2562684 RepID=UPI0010A5CECC|nr:four helix bundle protein [Allomuricauda onchidii]
MSDIKTFEDLECWKSGTKLRKVISKVIKVFPDYEKYELTSQMRRASRSVTHNIAEGYGRFHFKENAQFCRTSRGSVYELLDQILVALDEEYIDKEKYNELRVMIFDCLKILNGYINYLVKADNSK